MDFAHTTDFISIQRLKVNFEKQPKFPVSHREPTRNDHSIEKDLSKTILLDIGPANRNYSWCKNGIHPGTCHRPDRLERN
jgi:hypothetical protein